MKTAPECLPCLLNRVLETASRVAPDPWLHKKMLMEIVSAVADGDIDFERTPAEVLSDGIVRACDLLHADPFAEERLRLNESMLAHLTELQNLLGRQPDPLVAAGRLAVICNDLAVLKGPVDPAALVADAVSRRLAVDDFARLKEALAAAKRVIYVLDNAGEVVADRLMIEAIGPQRVTAVVRRRPLMRDALEADAAMAGITCRVVNAGCDAAGIPPSLIPAEFRRELDRADVIVGKGEASYQTLEEGPWRTFHLFVARCACTARHLSVAPGAAFCLGKDAATTKAVRRNTTSVAKRA